MHVASYPRGAGALMDFSGVVAGYFRHGNETMGSVNGVEFLQLLCDY
jgi:hypothetical protein